MKPDDIVTTDTLRDRVSELETERDQFIAETCEEAGIDEDHDDYDELCRETAAVWETQQPEGEEYAKLIDILDEVGSADYLVNESYFVDYAREMLEDCGEIPRKMPWYIEIDWEATAENIKSDYSEIEIDGQTYLYRD
jgi:predicted nuclease with TOPRIM domain